MNKKISVIGLILIMMLGTLVMLVNAQDDLPETPLRIHFTSEALYPEGIAYDAAHERFLVSSLRQGVITALYYDAVSELTEDADGRTEVFIDDDDLVSAIGIHIDEERGRLLVANSDPGASVKTSEDTQGALAELGIYDLETGERLHLVDLDDLAPDGGHFANDMTYDADGNVYVTDSFSPIIYKVDVDGNAEIFLQDERFTGGGFNLNGIVLHPDSYLIVAKHNEGVLFKVPLDDPTAFTEVQIDETFPGSDGLVLMEDGTLFLVDNRLGGDDVSQIVKLESDDDWTSANVLQSFDVGDSDPTTATRRGDTVHVLFGRLNVLFNPETTNPASEFEIVRADCCYP